MSTIGYKNTNSPLSQPLACSRGFYRSYLLSRRAFLFRQIGGNFTFTPIFMYTMVYKVRLRLYDGGNSWTLQEV